MYIIYTFRAVQKSNFLDKAVLKWKRWTTDERTVLEMWIFLHQAHKEEEEKMKQNKLIASSIHHLEATVVNLQSQLHSYSTKISEII